jgi:heme/copper-type cytochrome/quinol oxidase subunit 2
MFPRALVVVGVVVVLVVAPALYLYSSSQSANSVEINIQIVGDGTDYYVPANLTVRQGEVVTLAVFNSDDNTHGLDIPAFNVDTGIIPHGITARVTFTASKIGTFQFFEPAGYCTGGKGNVCNSAQDLRGKLTVTP